MGCLVVTHWTGRPDWVAGALAAVLVAASPLAVRATPLAKDACDQLSAEKARLVGSGVADRMSKGASWGKANLAEEKLREIERYIEVEEQLSFRCGLAKVKLAPEPPDPDAVPAAPAPAATPTPPKRRPVPKAPVAKAPAAAGPAAASAAAPAAPNPAPAVKTGPPAAVTPLAPKPAAPRPKPQPAAKAPAAPPTPTPAPDAPAKAVPGSTGLPPG